MAASPSQLPRPTTKKKGKKLPRSVPSDSPEEEVNLYLKIFKTVALKVRRNSTLKHIKATIQDKEQIDERSQELFFGGRHLEDGKRLVDYGIHGDSTLHLILQDSTRIAVNVKISSTQKSLLVEATRLDTVRNVKLMIQAKEGIRLHEFALVFSGKVLAEERTLASLNLLPEPTFHLVFHPKDDVSVIVDDTSGRRVTLGAKSWYTVRDLKAIVGALMSAQVMSLHMVYKGMQLEDQKTLACYNIADDSVLQLVSSNAPFQISVKYCDGKTVLQVCRSDKVEEVKNKLLDKLQVRVPPERHHIYYGGKRLADDLDLASYGIQDNSILFGVI